MTGVALSILFTTVSLSSRVVPGWEKRKKKRRKEEREKMKGREGGRDKGDLIAFNYLI